MIAPLRARRQQGLDARSRLAVALSLVAMLGTGCSPVAQGSTPVAPAATLAPAAVVPAVERDPDVPELPFADNPDPSQCGIPAPFGDYSGRLTGVYQGQLIQPTVYLYDSHLRHHVTARVPSGTPVRVELHQANPVLDFYYVRAETPEGARRGWVPAPFVELGRP